VDRFMAKSININKGGSYLVAAITIWKSFVGISCMQAQR